MLYQQRTRAARIYSARGWYAPCLSTTQLYENRRDPKLTEEGQTYLENIDTLPARAACAAL